MPSTLTPVAGWDVLTNLMPVDGVDLRSALSIKGLFQAIVDRLEFLNPANGTGGAPYASLAALNAALPPAIGLRGKTAIVNSGAANTPDSVYMCLLKGNGTYDWISLTLGF